MTEQNPNLEALDKTKNKSLQQVDLNNKRKFK